MSPTLLHGLETSYKVCENVLHKKISKLIMMMQVLYIYPGGKPGPHSIQGIGMGIVPDTLDMTVYDQIVPVHSDEAMEMARRLQKEDSLLVGISSGAAFAAALKVKCTQPQILLR